MASNYVVFPACSERCAVLEARLPHFEELAVFFDLADVQRRLRDWQTRFPSVQAFYATRCCDFAPVLKELGQLYQDGLLAGFVCGTRAHCEAVLSVNTPVQADGVVYSHSVAQTSHLVRAKELGVAKVAVSSAAELDALVAHHSAAHVIVRITAAGNEAELFDAVQRRGLTVGGLLLDLGSDASADDLLRGIERVRQLCLAKGGVPLVNLGEGFTADNADQLAPAVASLRGQLPADVQLAATPSHFLLQAAQHTAFQLADVNAADGLVFSDCLADAVTSLPSSLLTCTASNATTFRVVGLSSSSPSSSSLQLPSNVQAGSWLVLSGTGAYTAATLRRAYAKVGSLDKCTFFYRSNNVVSCSSPSSSSASSSSSSSSTEHGCLSIVFEGIAVDRLLDRDATFNRQRHLQLIAAEATSSSSEASEQAFSPFTFQLANGTSVRIALLSEVNASADDNRDIFARVGISVRLADGVAVDSASLAFVQPLLYRCIGWLHPDRVAFTLTGRGAEVRDQLSASAPRLQLFPWLSPKIFVSRAAPQLADHDGAAWTYTHVVYYDAQRQDSAWAMENLDDCAAGGEKYTYGVSVRRVLFECRSLFQHIVFFDSTQFGRCMMLDGHLQFTEHDECAYQEMLCHLPICSHPDAKRVLIVGGGDLFCAREVLRYESVAEVVNVEIDTQVTLMCSWFIPDTYNVKHHQPRFTLVHQDASLWVDAHHAQRQFDVIIVDSSDPTEESPAKVLYQQPFLRQLFDMLSPDGILSYQGETYWDYLPFIRKFMNTLRSFFPEVRHATGQIPTYPNGQMGYTIARKSSRQDAGTGLETPRRLPPATGLKFYTPALHTAAFALPKFIETQLSEETQE